jgi:hypothetical protein
VLYYSRWQQAFPKRNDYQVGIGIPEIERIDDPFNHIDEVDLFVFPDLYNAPVQNFLRSLGKLVWGNSGAEEAELDRWQFKKWMEQVGLPAVPTAQIIGMKALREHLKTVEDKYIKTSRFRGDQETWHHVDYETSESFLDKREYSLGPIKDQVEFLVEDSVKGIEVGQDTFTINGQYPEVTSIGYEIKDVGFVGVIKPYTEIHPELQNIDSKMSQIFQAFKSRGDYSNEIRISDDGQFYLTDPTIRRPYPPGEALMEVYENLGEIMYYGAQGQLIVPRPLTKYFAIARIECPNSEDDWSTVFFPPELRQWVKIHDLTIIKNRPYAVPHRIEEWTRIGSVIGFGESVDDAIATVRERAEQLKGFKLSTTEDKLDEAKKAIADGEKVGIDFS